MSAKQLDRVLSSYYEADNDSDKSGAALLPQVLNASEESEHENISANEDKRCSKYNLAHVTQQSMLFMSFFTVACFSLEVLRPYLPLYYSQLGLTAKEIGIIGSVQSFVAIFYTSLIGYIADKFAIRRYIMVSSLLLHAVVPMAILYVPKIRTKECNVCGNISLKAVNEHFENCTSASDELYLSLRQGQDTSNDLYNSHDLQTVFIYIIVINVLVILASSPWNPIADGYLLASLGPKRRDQYGYFKGVAGIGRCVGILVGGIALGLTSYTFLYCNVAVEKVKFQVVFFLNASSLILAAFLAWWMSRVPDVKISKSTATYSISTLIRCLCRLRYFSVIIVITWLSVACGKMKTFDFWYIKTLGGTYILMGVGGFISKAVFAITSFCLPFLNEKCGHIPLLILACIVVGAGCIIASFTTNVVWMVIPLVAREVAVAIYYQAQGAFLGNAVDDQYQATLQSMMTSLTSGVGKGLGSLLGGSIIEAISPAMSYYIFAAVSFMMAIFLTAVQMFLKMTESIHDF